jgi:hypothetical protein
MCFLLFDQALPEAKEEKNKRQFAMEVPPSSVLIKDRERTTPSSEILRLLLLV